MKNKHEWINTELLKTENVFENLFSRPEEMVDKITEHMKAHNFDDSQPINVWHRKEEESLENFVVVDGHTRLLAAKKAGLSQVYVTVMDFSDEYAALQYAIHNQRDRRNIGDAEIIKCIETVDKRKNRGGDQKSADAKSKASYEAIDSGKSSERTAEIVGTSRSKVERARFIRAHADEQTKQDVREGKKTINRAYNEIRQKKKDQKVPSDNENGEKIEDESGTPKLSFTLDMAFKKFLAEVKQAKMNGYRDSSKKAIVDCLKTIRQLLEE